MILTEEEVKAIRERAEAATPGPWKWDETLLVVAEARAICEFFDDTALDGDAAFVAHARTDVPALAESHEELRERVSRLERKCAMGDQLLAGARICAGEDRALIARLKAVVDAARSFRKADKAGSFDDRVATGRALDEALVALHAKEPTAPKAILGGKR